MKLVRNTRNDGKCKYALIEREKNYHIEYGLPHTENEFFVIKLKDLHAVPALLAYANSAKEFDEEYANEILELVNRSGINNKWCKLPD